MREELQEMITILNINTDFTLDSVCILLYLTAYYDKIITITGNNLIYIGGYEDVN